MIRLLDGVHPNFAPEILVALRAAEGAWNKYGADTLWITSGGEPDAGHKPDSLHYAKPYALAVDLRTKNLAPALVSQAHAELRAALGPRYDVVLETDPPHVHVEYDPLHLNPKKESRP